MTRYKSERGEESEILQGNSDEWYIPSHLEEDSTRDDEEAKMTSERSQENSFIVITLYQELNCTCREKNTFPIPMKYIDVTRTTQTSLDVLMEKHIEDYWNVDGERELSDAWTGFTRFVLLKERPRDGYTWSGEKLTRKHTTSRPDNVWPEMWTHMSDAAKKKAQQRWELTMKAARRKLVVPDASSNALQNTDKEQWRNPPQYWETQDKICLYC